MVQHCMELEIGVAAWVWGVPGCQKSLWRGISLLRLGRCRCAPPSLVPLPNPLGSHGMPSSLPARAQQEAWTVAGFPPRTPGCPRVA